MANQHIPLISTSALAKKLDLPAKALFELFVDKGWIERIGDHWKLTGKGQFEGGDYVTSKKYGEYIGWPESIDEHQIFSELFNRPLRTGILASELKVSAHRFNALLAELGWQTRHHRGWILTDLGKSLGGGEAEDNETGVPYTLWPRSILDNERLTRVLRQISPPRTRTDNSVSSDQRALDFDGESEQDYLRVPALDGHIHQSISTKVLCNWLYLMRVTHACHKPLEYDELGCCDFYIPHAQLYIEVWQSSEQSRAMSQRLERLDYYRENNLPHIELKTEQLDDLDRALPKLLLKHGITVY